MAITPALLVVAVAIGIAGGTRATGASAAVTPAIPAAAKTVPACTTDDLTGTLFGQPRDPHSTVRAAVLRLTNTSDRACQVKGWADIAMVTPPGDLVKVPTRKVTQPEGGAKITLEPQRNAWTRVEWDMCDATRNGCGVGVALQYTVDSESTGAVADTTGIRDADFTMKALRISPFQPTRTAAALY